MIKLAVVFDGAGNLNRTTKPVIQKKGWVAVLNLWEIKSYIITTIFPHNVTIFYVA